MKKVLDLLHGQLFPATGLTPLHSGGVVGRPVVVHVDSPKVKSKRSYFMGFAEHAATASKDSTKVGAALIGPKGEVRLTGYNGPPIGVEDKPERFERPTKYLYASHAEQNLVAFAAREGIRTAGCDVYVTHRPCAGCAKSLIQAGIRAVFFGPGKTSMPTEEFIAAATMFREAGIRCDPVA
jgi:dCMP deaminase